MVTAVVQENNVFILVLYCLEELMSLMSLMSLMRKSQSMSHVLEGSQRSTHLGHQRTTTYSSDVVAVFCLFLVHSYCSEEVLYFTTVV